MIILGLGSNSGDRLAHLTAAIKELRPILRDMRLSRILESKALLLPDSPPDWDKPFLNMAVAGNTSLAPAELFIRIKSIEEALGRKTQGTWSPREIDIDILAMDNLNIATANLIIPHRELLNRDFALLPLAELVPDWVYPGDGGFKGIKAAEIVRAKGFALNANLKDSGLSIHVA